MRFLVAAAWLIVPSALPCILYFGPTARALVMAPLCTGIIAAASGLFGLVFGTATLPWVIVATVTLNLGSLLLFRMRRPASPPGRWPEVFIAAVALLPLLALQRPVIDWDARSIWLLHGRWFFESGDFLQQAIGNPAYVFSHPDYPPLVPATIGGLWDLAGSVDPLLGQICIGILQWSAVAMVGIALVRLIPRRVEVPAAGLGAIVALAAFGFAGPFGTNGYVDLLWAAAACSGAIHLLVARVDRRSLWIGIISTCVAGLSKNEGLVVALMILALAAVRLWTEVRLRVFMGASALLFSWPVAVRIFGASSDFQGGNLGGLITADPQVLSRLVPSGRAIGSYSSFVILLAVVAAAIGVSVLRRTRDNMGLGNPLLFWTVAIGYGLFLLVAYLVSPYDLNWHISTSVDRITIAIKLFLLADIAVWGLCAMYWLRSGDDAGERRWRPSH